MECKEKLIETKLGPQLITADKIITFPQGLIGFTNYHKFTLLQLKENSPFLVLQSLDNLKLGLLVADPFAFIKDYQVTISTADQKLLKAEHAKQLSTLVTVSIPCNQPEKTSLNLTGPIVINHEQKLGIQVAQLGNDFPMPFCLIDKDNEETNK